MNKSIRLPKPALAGLVTAEVISAVLAWRDLTQRPDDQVRGAKTGWRLFITLNPGNSLAYWAIGRRRIRSETQPASSDLRTASE